MPRILWPMRGYLPQMIPGRIEDVNDTILKSQVGNGLLGNRPRDLTLTLSFQEEIGKLVQEIKMLPSGCVRG